MKIRGACTPQMIPTACARPPRQRYMRLLEKDDIKKLETGVKVFIEKDEWQLLL